MERFEVRTEARNVFVDVTDEVAAAVAGLGVQDGAVLVHVPHTTAAVTVNEGYDPDVAGDLLRRLAALAPHGHDTAGAADRHDEGNSDSHLKVALLGSSTLVPVEARATGARALAARLPVRVRRPRRRTVWVSRLADGGGARVQSNGVARRISSARRPSAAELRTRVARRKGSPVRCVQGPRPDGPPQHVPDGRRSTARSSREAASTQRLTA
jgi:secondary thiamine-phosphate synthase enzyme